MKHVKVPTVKTIRDFKSCPSHQVLLNASEPRKIAPLNALFAQDARRFSKFSVSAGPLFLDYSKNWITQEVQQALLSLATECGVADRISEMFAGEKINATEGRAVLHTLLRAPENAASNGLRAEHEAVHHVLRDMSEFAEHVRSGECVGARGKPFTDVVNIGIGGSDLGPAMVFGALGTRLDRPRVHFVSNVDGAHLADTLDGLDLETTLFLIASKTFTTQETMLNANSARARVADELGEGAVSRHFAAISTNIEAAKAFGISQDRVFGFWDWVGGRYSLWSAIGLSVMIGIGPNRFRTLLDGAHEMDVHFRTKPFAENMPVILAMLGVWYRNYHGLTSHAVLPYDQRLHRLPAFLQQLDMESNGKRVAMDGTVLDHKTGPVIWGEPGTNGQHAFFQLLHQGTDVIPCDFLLAAKPHEASDTHHRVLAANCFAQAEALMRGKTEQEARGELDATQALDAERLARHKSFPGNRPSNTLLYERLDPKTLGALIALYEHKVFVQGVIWGVNSFDQWGVELGKQLGGEVLAILNDEASADGKDGSTQGLIQHFKSLRAAPQT